MRYALCGDGGEGENDCDGGGCEGTGFEVDEVAPFEDGKDDCREFLLVREHDDKREREREESLQGINMRIPLAMMSTSIGVIARREGSTPRLLIK